MIDNYFVTVNILQGNIQILLDILPQGGFRPCTSLYIFVVNLLLEVVLGLASCSSSYVLLKLLPETRFSEEFSCDESYLIDCNDFSIDHCRVQIPVRPDDNEDVASDGEKEEATNPGSVFGIDHVSKDLDQIKDQADDG